MQSMGCSSNRLRTPAIADAIWVSVAENFVLDDVDAVTARRCVRKERFCSLTATEQTRIVRMALFVSPLKLEQ